MQLARHMVLVKVAFLDLGAPVVQFFNVFVEEHLHRTVVRQGQLRVHAQCQGMVHTGQVVQILLTKPSPNSLDKADSYPFH